MKGKIVFVIILIVVVLLCVYGVKNKPNINEVENTVVNTVSNTVEENKVKENKIKNEAEEEKTNVVSEVLETNSTTIYETNPEIGTTDKKEQAINLVKEKWGKDDTVTFRCDDITKDGEYIIAVVSKETATVKNFFKVNLEAKTVEVDY